MVVLRRSLTQVGTILVSLVVFGLIWVVTLHVRHVSSYVSSTPKDVYEYLFTLPTAGANRHQILVMLGVTLRHAALAFVVGILASVLVAVCFELARPVRLMFMPLAMLLRTVPLMAMAPVVQIVFGTGLVTAALVGTIVVFFPLLVNLTLGFESSSPQVVDVVRVSGGGSWTVMRKVAFPSALPYLLASMRIAVPGAITGAMLYEWLFTFSGMGGGIISANNSADFPLVWAIVVVITVVTVLLYAVAAVVETAVLARWAPSASAE